MKTYLIFIVSIFSFGISNAQFLGENLLEKTTYPKLSSPKTNLRFDRKPFQILGTQTENFRLDSLHTFWKDNLPLVRNLYFKLENQKKDSALFFLFQPGQGWKLERESIARYSPTGKLIYLRDQTWDIQTGALEISNNSTFYYDSEERDTLQIFSRYFQGNLENWRQSCQYQSFGNYLLSHYRHFRNDTLMDETKDSSSISIIGDLEQRITFSFSKNPNQSWAPVRADTVKIKTAFNYLSFSRNWGWHNGSWVLTDKKNTTWDSQNRLFESVYEDIQSNGQAYHSSKEEFSYGQNGQLKSMISSNNFNGLWEPSEIQNFSYNPLNQLTGYSLHQWIDGIKTPLDTCNIIPDQFGNTDESYVPNGFFPDSLGYIPNLALYPFPSDFLFPYPCMRIWGGYRLKAFFSPLTSTSETTQGNGKLQVYPNPASKKIYVKGLPAGVVGLSIYSLTGKKIKDIQLETNQQETILEPRLYPGMYLMKTEGSKNQQTIKFCIEH